MVQQRKQQRSVVLQTRKNSHNKMIRESSKESIITNDLGPQSPLQWEKNASGVYHQELIRPARYGIAKENAANGYPRQRISWDPLGILAWNPQSGTWAISGSQNISKAKMVYTIPGYRAQADSATSFYILRGHVRSPHACVYFVQ